MPEAPTPVWHALPAEAAVQATQSDEHGLSSQAALARLRAHGPNHLPRARPRSALRRWLAQFENLLIQVLLVAAAVTLALGHFVDALVILAVVLVNAVIGHLQEGRAERALAGLARLLDPACRVQRDGQRLSLPVADLVPGDIVLLEAGERVPADLRLLRANALRIDESLLTGESVPVDKQVEAVAEEAAVADRRCMAFGGSLVTGGVARGLVVATGADTELGRIGHLLGGVRQLKTPLLERMDRFARRLTLLILGLSVAVLLLAVGLHATPWEDAFLAVVGLAVAAIPEGLPAVMTVTLAIGVQQMAQRQAVIRRLPAVETLGAVTVICSDKTGTLTRNQMSVARLQLAEASADIKGTGYAPTGGVHWREADPPAALGLAAARVGLLCNDAALCQRGEDWEVIGDPMEGALLAFAARCGLDLESELAAHPRLSELPFDASRLYMASVHDIEGSPRALIKGAPERVLALCASQAQRGQDIAIELEVWQACVEAMAAEGLRVLALADAQLAADEAPSHEALAGRSRLLGLVGLIDPPREQAMAAIAECRAAGVRVKMITGDHAATALAIAARLELAAAPRVLTGPELDRLDESEFARAAADTEVFARVSPEHKLRLVRALQAGGEVVAMTGDGVNDAPALKRADVGVAMGANGSETAREAAEVVLLDDNFASIVAAVREGRVVFDNLRKVIAWTLPTNGGETLAIMAALLLGLALPISPVQILWVNMITAGALGLTLAFEPAEPGIMQRPPRGRAAPLLSGFLIWRVVLVSLLFVTAVFGIFEWSQTRGDSLELSRTLVVNALVVLEIAYLFTVRYLDHSSLGLRQALGTPAVLLGVAITVLAQLAFTYAPPLQAVFATAAVGPIEGAVVLGSGILFLLVMETEKALIRRWRG
jgi:magnesium-transporting ATPase (P-type)